MPYEHNVFINLPVSNLEKSIAFYTAVGFVQNKTFSNDQSAMMSLPRAGGSTSGPEAHEGTIKIMLLAHPFFKGFLPKTVEIADATKVSQVLVCFSRESKEAVDEFVEKAAANGGRKDIKEKSDAEKQAEQGGMHGGA